MHRSPLTPDVPSEPFPDTGRETPTPTPARPDLAELRRTVTRGGEPLARAGAIVELAASGHPAADRDLAAVLTAGSAPAHVRRVAAVELGRLATPRSLEALATAAAELVPADGAEEELLASVAAILGRTADASAREAVRSARDRLAGDAAERARFAERLLVHRWDLPLDEKGGPPAGEELPLHDGWTRPMRVTEASGETLARCLVDLATEGPGGVELSARAGCRLECQRRTWMALLERGLAAAGGFRRLTERRLVSALVARRVTDGGWELAMLLLSTPGGDGAELRLVRPDGELVMSGRAAVDADGATLRLDAVQAPGAFPARVAALLADGRLEILRADAGLVATPKLSPEPLEIDPA